MGERNQITKRPVLRLFGGFQFYNSDGQPISVSLRKAEALLAYLAVSAGQVASRETLAALLWGEFEQHRARQSLRQVLLALTKALAVCDGPFLRIESQQVSLVPGSISVDVVEFEQLIQETTPRGLATAAALYRGDFLAGLRLDAPDFEDWLSATKSRLHDLALQGLADLLEHQEAAEEIGPAVATANQALRIDPFREDIHRRLMAVYIRKGMRSSALTQYRLCREILERELGVPPDEETTELYKQILDRGPEDTGGWSVKGPVAAPKRSTEAPAEVRMPRVSTGREALIGRDSEMERLRAAFAGVVNGKGHCLTIAGEAGIGKTCLVSSFLDEVADDDLSVLSLRAREAEQSVALVPWVKGLKDRAAGHGSEDLDQLALEVVRELRRWSPGLGEQDQYAAPGTSERRRLYDSVVSLMQALCSGTRLVVVFEDLQWADAESLHLLLYAARACTASPVLLICTVRAEDLGYQQVLAERLAELERESLLSWLTLKPLSREDTRELIAHLQRSLGAAFLEQHDQEDLWALSEGNPQVIVESLLELGAEGDAHRWSDDKLPRQIRSEVWRLRSRLGGAAKRLVDTACVFGPRSNYALVTQASGSSEDEMAAAVEELVRGQVLVVEGEELVFLRIRVCRALYEDMVPPRRKIIHAAAADTIEQIHGRSLEPHYQNLARHRREAGQIRQAIEPALCAAAVEMKRGAFGATRKILQEIVKWQEALHGDGETHPLAADVHLAMGYLGEAEGSLEVARSSFKAAQTLAGRQANSRKAAEILIALSRIRCRDGDRAGAFETLRRGLTLAARSGCAAPWGPVESFVSRLHLIDGGRDSLNFRLERRMQHDRALGLRTDEAEATALRGLAAATRGSFGEALSYCEKAIGIAETSGSEATVGACLEAEGMVRLWRGDSQGALDCFDRSVEIAEARGDLPRLYVLGGHRGIALHLGGRSEEAASTLQRSITIAEKINTRFFLPLFKAWFAEAAAGAGGGEEAFALSREAYRAAAEANQPWASSVAARALAVAFTQRRSRDFTRAERAIRASIETQNGLGLRFELARSLVVRAKILRAQGEASRSSDSFSEAGEMFREMGMASESARAKTMAEALRPAT